MADVDAKVGLVNRALMKLGLPASFTTDAESNLGGIVDLVWPGLVARVSTIYNWSTFQKTKQADALADTPANGWAYGFALPGDRVGEILAVLREPTREHYLRDYMIEAGQLFTNETPVYLRYRALQDPRYWDAGFSEAFVVALAGELAIPLLQSDKMADKFRGDAFGRLDQNDGGGLFGKLITLNRSAMPQGRRFMDDDQLTRARFM